MHLVTDPDAASTGFQKTLVVVYYCSTKYRAVSCARGGRGIVEDMSYEIRRAEACVD
jgi:hypothetical protein